MFREFCRIYVLFVDVDFWRVRVVFSYDGIFNLEVFRGGRYLDIEVNEVYIFLFFAFFDLEEEEEGVIVEF